MTDAKRAFVWSPPRHEVRASLGSGCALASCSLSSIHQTLTTSHTASCAPRCGSSAGSTRHRYCAWSVRLVFWRDRACQFAGPFQSHGCRMRAQELPLCKTADGQCASRSRLAPTDIRARASSASSDCDGSFARRALHFETVQGAGGCSSPSLVGTAVAPSNCMQPRRSVCNRLATPFPVLASSMRSVSDAYRSSSIRRNEGCGRASGTRRGPASYSTGPARSGSMRLMYYRPCWKCHLIRWRGYVVRRQMQLRGCTIAAAWVTQAKATQLTLSCAL